MDRDRLDSVLLPNEHVIWTGAPDARRLFTRADVFLVPFSLLWGGFAIFWFFGALEQGGLGFALFGLPFVTVGLYLIAGRFLYKRRKARRTRYVLTDRRVIEASTGPRTRIRAEFIDRVPAINHDLRNDGSGTIRFGNWNWASSVYGNTGLDFFAGMYGDTGLIFYEVADARAVVEHLDRLR